MKNIYVNNIKTKRKKKKKKNVTKERRKNKKERKIQIFNTPNQAATHLSRNHASFILQKTFPIVALLFKFSSLIFSYFQSNIFESINDRF